MPGLYIHIPFCAKKCAYCDFYSVETDQRIEPFLRELGAELGAVPPAFRPETVFIGGGTPTVLSAGQIQALLSAVAGTVDLSRVTEFSCEANPGTIDIKKLTVLRAAEVNRLSLGVQSFDDRILRTLGRIHNAAQAGEAAGLARAAGFANLNLDLIFGVPGQTLRDVESDLDRALALKPEHLAVYNLIYERGTPLAEANPTRLDEELEREMYDFIRARLTSTGFVHYEISNFAKPGFECRHNLLYWSGGQYIGCGPSAHSHWQGRRWSNAADLDEYCLRGPRREGEEHLGIKAKARETLVMGLRLLEGADVPELLCADLEPVLRRLETEGLIARDGRRVCLTGEALFVSNSVFAELV